MRTLTTLTVLVPTLVLAGCSGDVATSPRSQTLVTAPRATDASRALASRSISGQCRLTALATDPYPAPPVFRQVAVGACELSHLGRVTVQFTQVVNFAARTQQSLELTYTAPNGDVLRAASAGTSAPTATGVTYSATLTFLGGTGRFANASGQAHADGTADLVAGTSQYTLDGWITYDAADRNAR